MVSRMDWLPKNSDWDTAFEAARDTAVGDLTLQKLAELANFNLDFLQTMMLDRLTCRFFRGNQSAAESIKPTRLALLGSSTISHLVPGIRTAGLRRKLRVEVYTPEYGQYLHELMNHDSPLHQFAPQFVCIALDARHIANLSAGNIDAALEHLRNCWRLAKKSFNCTVIQQKFLPVFPDLLGSNEYRMSDSPQAFLSKLNIALEAAADDEGIQLLATDKYAAEQGVRTWHDASLWLRSKQEVHPAVAPLYGEYLARLIAAQLGRSSKCLVLDLDNTLWGGVIGDDGLEGIVLGQGNAAGEAFVDFQRYLLQLKNRGVILAVCSKNDEANAVLPFEQHPEMLLKRSDIALFVANWDDKANNLKHVAKALNIGIESLVFADDNPFERNLVRRELPDVAVPELPEDPALYVQTVASAGYFEGLVLTEEDRERTDLYRANAERQALQKTATDLPSYLRSMEMEITCRPFDEISLQRVTQLINKTNQFNLTTQRYSEAEVRAVMHDPNALGFYVRLKDKFGDNGIIAILIGKLCDDSSKGFEIETWLMSCRVLGRQVEQACLNQLVDGARRLGAHHMIGEYRPTAKNGMVSDLYSRLGFTEVNNAPSSSTRWRLDLDAFEARDTFIRVTEPLYAGN